MSKKHIYFIVFLVFIPQCKAGTNVALHKSYSFNPAPNYNLCTDAGDRVQLTDGEKAGSWWVKSSTVGWRWGSANIEVVIDLESNCSIDTVRVYSVGGGFANVEFSEFIAVLVSTDGRNYRFVRVIDNQEVAEVRSVGHNRVPHTFVLSELNVEARFVKLIVRPSRAYFFLDEIEVIGDRADSIPRVGHRKDMAQFEDTRPVIDAIEGYFELKKTLEETKRFIDRMRDRITPELYHTISSGLTSLAVKCPLPAKNVYLPDELLKIKRELGVLRGTIYKEMYGKSFFCFVANPMERLLAREMIGVDPNAKSDMEITLWQKEYESSAIHILNCSGQPIDISVSLSPTIREDGSRMDNENIYSVRRAIFVNVLGLGQMADPLVLQTNEPFSIEPGAIAQIWLTVCGKNLCKGRYHSSIGILGSLDGEVLPIQIIKMDVNVADLTFPDQASLNTCVWDEYTWVSNVTKNEQPTAASDLKDHYTNVGVVHPSLIPFLKIPYQHKGTFEKYLAYREFYRMHLFYFGWRPEKSNRSHERDGGRFGEWMSLSWKRNFTLWLQELVKILKEKGIDYDRFAIYPFDESLCDEFYQVAKLVKEIDPQIKIYANHFGRGPADFMRFKDLIDIWSPHWKDCKNHPDWLATIQSFGKEVWTYGTDFRGESRGNDDYSYYRLMSWEAFARGQTGAGFWVYSSQFKQPWNDGFQAKGYYDVIYGQAESPVDTGGETIIPSRRWEIWREGIEDYEYLVQLKKTIARVREKDEKAADEAESVLASQVQRVISNRERADLVYEARKTITKTFLELKEKTTRQTIKK